MAHEEEQHDEVVGNLLANLVRIQRLGNGLSRDAERLIQDLFDELAAQIARIDPTGPQADRHRRQRLEKLLGRVGEISADRFKQLRKQVRNDLARVGVDQAAYAERQLRAALGSVAVDIRPGRIGLNLVKAVLDTDLVEGTDGFGFAAWFRAQDAALQLRLSRQLRLGMSQNETLDALVRRVRGTQSGFRYRDAVTGAFVKRGTAGATAERVFTGGVMQTTTREAEAFLRTAINHVSNRAQRAFYEANQDVTEEWEFAAVLDERTTLECASLDGQRFRYDDEAAPWPPRHWQCRSAAIPVVNWRALGIDPPEEVSRAGVDGPVPASLNYEAWLRRQSPARVRRILGPGRAELFLERGVSLSDMVKGDGSIVRLDELRQAS